MISVVIPVYKAENTLDELVDRLEQTLPAIDPAYEIILINDRSPDSSWQVIERIGSHKKFVKGIHLSRNFGQHKAISAGLDNCKGEWIVVMDCDLQDQPEEIVRLYSKAQEGYEAVFASRHNRQDSFIKKLFSKIFYSLLSYLTGTRQDESLASFGIYSSKFIDVIRGMRESIRYFPTMVQWVGFTTYKLPVEHHERKAGKSGYNFRKLSYLAMDIILAYSDKPLRLTVKFGIAIAFIAFGFACYTLLLWWRGEIVVLGYASIIISIWFLTGCILTTLGVVGLYIGKIFEGVKRRPIYIIEKTVGI